MTDKIREDFEKWAVQSGFCILKDEQTGSYASRDTHLMFRSFKKAAALYKPKWLPIEQAPKDSQWQIVKSEFGIHEAAYNGVKWFIPRNTPSNIECVDLVCRPTHFMPLPEVE